MSAGAVGDQMSVRDLVDEQPVWCDMTLALSVLLTR
jgi:hypothetical protein